MGLVRCTGFALAVALGLAAPSCDAPEGPPAPSEPPTVAAPAADPASTNAPVVPGPSAAPTEDPRARPHGYALLRAGATVHLRADDRVPPVVLPAAGAPVAVAATGRDGELVAVETLVDATGHCVDGTLGLSGLRLRWLVAPADLLPVTTRRTTVEYGDGTRAELLGGVPLRETAEGWFADASGVEVYAPVPEDAIGTFYELGDRAFVETTRTPLGEGDEPLIYDRTRTLDEGRLERVYLERARVATFDRQERDGRVVAEVRSRCAALRVIAPSSRTRAEPEGVAHAGILGMIGSGGGGAFADVLGVGAPPSWRVDGGASVYWRDGTLGGLVDRERSFDRPPQTVDARLCFPVDLAGAPTAQLELCFDAAAVHEIPGASTGGPEAPGEVFGLIGTGPGASLGSFGTPGTGGGGLGALAAPKRTSKTTLGTAVVTTGLDKDIIRRIVRAHIGEVRHCYNRGLVTDPALAGKITVGFTIGPDGDVSTATVKDDTMGDASVAACLTKAVRRWKFPKPVGGGVVAVQYPFTFAPG